MITDAQTNETWSGFMDQLTNMKVSPDVRLQTAINAMTDSLYAIEAGDAKHAVTILRDTLERLNQN